MQAKIFDDRSRRLGDDSTRRGFLRQIGTLAAVGTLSVACASSLGESAMARRRRKKKKQRGQNQVCPQGCWWPS
jgi:hypothetical protein